LEPQLKDTEKQTTVFLAELGIFPSFSRRPDTILAILSNVSRSGCFPAVERSRYAESLSDEREQ
jgi:hypothetical protein